MSRVTLSSASGLRPMSAFVVIGTVLLSVAGWVVHLAAVGGGGQPARLRTEVGAPPAFAIADARGRTLARFVPRFDLLLSPRSMWQMHTPRFMAEEISAVLGGDPGPDELLQELLPDAIDGRIEVTAWDLSARQASRLAEWIAAGAGSEAGPLDGIAVVEVGGAEERRTWRLVWEPAVLLSRAERARHGATSAWTWGRTLAGGIAAALSEPTDTPPRGAVDRDALRAEVWEALIPRAHYRAVRGIPAERVDALRELLAYQGVAPLQMRVDFGRDRFYPAGEHELFGSWGFTSAEQTEAAPREGLELLCERYLEDPVWDELIRREPAVYRWLQDRTVRGQRENGYVDFHPASAAPVVETTLDLALQRFVRLELERLVKEHRPALAMAIVLDVQSGDVLAVDSVEEYEIQPFAPVYHVFTTGSTLKVITMASALEQRVVTPEEELDVGQGAFRVHYADGRPSARVIREARGAPTGVITAQMAFARSSNAGMTQIGLRVPDEFFHGRLTRLGYGRPPGAGLGVERAGFLARLPWKYAYTHTSVCFGHEISTTLWQHATALATVARGGVHRPLRIVSAVEQQGSVWELALDEGERVFRKRTCETVRDMMRLGAWEGTGTAAREELEGIVAASLCVTDGSGRVDLGTKTGTAQKVGGEICVHVEMPARLAWRDQGLTATRARFEALRSVTPPHPSCYTSSICVFGSRQGGRELMVMVVAEEPRGKERYGSKVSGPTAARILAEALTFTRAGEAPVHDLVQGFAASAAGERNEDAEPWREGGKW